MVASKYDEAKRKAKAEIENATAVSLTDMWTSNNMDAYLAITCHYINDNDKQTTVLLDVENLCLKIDTQHNFAFQGFLNQIKMTVKRLKAECENVIRGENERPSTSTQSTESPSSSQQPSSKSIYFLFFHHNIIIF